MSETSLVSGAVGYVRNQCLRAVQAEPSAVCMGNLFSRIGKEMPGQARHDKLRDQEDRGYENLITFPKLYSNRFYVSKIESV